MAAKRKIESPYLTADELAQHWRVTTRHIYFCVEKQGLPHKRIGQALRFDLERVEAWADERAKH